MKALNKHQRKVFMWYKVKELQSKGLNKSQIALEVGIHRKTVRKYLNMNEEDFHKWIKQGKNLPKKLQFYHHYVYKLLDAHPYLSAAQVEDRLKEDFSDLPPVHSKKVYNFTESIRTHGLLKCSQLRLLIYQLVKNINPFGQMFEMVLIVQILVMGDLSPPSCRQIYQYFMHMNYILYIDHNANRCSNSLSSRSINPKCLDKSIFSIGVT